MTATDPKIVLEDDSLRVIPIAVLAERHLAAEKALPNPELEPFVKVERAAKILGLGKSTVYEAIKAGQIPHLRIQGRLIIPTAALRKLALLDETEAS